MPILEDWFINERENLCGAVYGHPIPRHEDGKHIKTSTIMQLNMHDWTAEVASGRIYYLGKPSKEYTEWLIKNGWDSGLLLKKRLEEYEGSNDRG